MGGIRLGVLERSSKYKILDILRMRGIKNSQLFEMKGQIEKIPVSHQKAILRILMDADCIFTENQNGVFFDIKTLPKEVIHKIKEYLKFYADTEKREQKRETEETELRDGLKDDPYHTPTDEE